MTAQKPSLRSLTEKEDGEISDSELLQEIPVYYKKSKLEDKDQPSFKKKGKFFFCSKFFWVAHYKKKGRRRSYNEYPRNENRKPSVLHANISYQQQPAFPAYPPPAQPSPMLNSMYPPFVPPPPFIGIPQQPISQQQPTPFPSPFFPNPIQAVPLHPTLQLLSEFPEFQLLVNLAKLPPDLQYSSKLLNCFF
jgi:hypothetical protein